MIQFSQPFENILVPYKALLIYRSPEGDNIYTEAYDIDQEGIPKNAHPLSKAESIGLANSLADSKELSSAYLQPEGLLPENLLFLRGGMAGFAIWHTPRQQVELKFVPSLGIPCGMAEVPAMVWKANRKELKIYAVKPAKGKRPAENLMLYHAPFFNIYFDGRVCMGTVEIDIPEHSGLEQFISLWQQYFLGSYFSHSMQGHQPLAVNMVELWKDQVQSRKSFPEKVLLKAKITLKDLLP